MDGYMMFTQKLDCHVLKASEVHTDLFKGANRAFKKIPWDVIEQKRHNKPRTVTQQVIDPCTLLGITENAGKPKEDYSVLSCNGMPKISDTVSLLRSILRHRAKFTSCCDFEALKRCP